MMKYLRIEPAFDWVTTPSKEELANLNRDQSILYLSDQKYVEKKRVYHFKSCLFRVNNQNDLKSYSSLNITFNPAYETIVFHQIRIKNGAEIKDITKKIFFTEIQRELDLEQNIFLGLKTYVSHLENINLGTEIEYNYTILSSNPLYQQHSEIIFQLNFFLPVSLVRYSVINATKNNFRIYRYKTESDFKIVQSGQKEKYELTLENIDAVYLEENMVPWDFPFSFIELSSFRDWEEFGNWITPLYESHEVSSKSLGKYITSLRNLKSDDERLTEVYNFVCNNIRYQGIEIGSHSIMPHDVSETYEKRYGDCKDKSLLLKYILCQLNFDASVLLVSSVNKKTIADRVPAISCFNHAIVVLEYRNEIFYLDPTVMSQAFTVSNRSEMNWGFGFHVNEKKITAIESVKNNLYKKNIDLRFKLNGTDAELTVIANSQFHSATQMSYVLNTQRKEELDGNFLNFYSKLYPTIKPIGQIESEIIPAENLVVTTEKYNIVDFWKVDGQNPRYLLGMFQPNDLYEVLSFPKTGFRKNQYYIPHPVDYTVTTMIILDVKMRLKNDSKTIDNSHFLFEFYTSKRGNIFEFTYAYKSKVDVVLVHEFPEYCENLRQVDNMLQYNILKGGSRIREIYNYYFYGHPFFVFIFFIIVLIFIGTLFEAIGG